MNEQLTKEILEIVRSSKDFVGAQTPQLVSEVITYGRYQNCLNGAAWLVVLFLIYRSYFLMRKVVTPDKEELWVPWGVAALTLFLLGTTLAYHNFQEASKAWLAPRYYLMDTLRGCQ